MPVLTRQMSQKQEEREEKPFDDLVSTCCVMYPVFCTANIPPKILDDFIDESYAGINDVIGDVDENGPGGAPGILQTPDLDSIKHGSRKPMPEFDSPFLNWTNDQIRNWMQKHRHRNFASSTFTILDQDAIDKKICRIGYISEIEPDDRMLNAISYADLQLRIPMEVLGMGWEGQACVGTDEVYDRKLMEQGK